MNVETTLCACWETIYIGLFVEGPQRNVFELCSGVYCVSKIYPNNFTLIFDQLLLNFPRSKDEEALHILHLYMLERKMKIER